MSPDMISCSIGNTMLQESTKVMLPIEQKPLRGMCTLFCRMAYRAGRWVKEKKNRRYAAYLLARDGTGEAIAETEDMTFGNDGIGVAQIERALIALEHKIAPLGYSRGSRRVRT